MRERTQRRDRSIDQRRDQIRQRPARARDRNEAPIRGCRALAMQGALRAVDARDLEHVVRQVRHQCDVGLRCKGRPLSDDLPVETGPRDGVIVRGQVGPACIALAVERGGRSLGSQDLLQDRRAEPA